MPKEANYATFFSTYLRQELDKGTTGDVQLDCPFLDCLKESHFGVNCDDGTWHCLRCDQGGNARTLITLLHQQYLTQTLDSQYIFLSDIRYISPETFKAAQFAYDLDNDRWLVPFFSYDPTTNIFSEFLNNLGIFYPSASHDPFVIRRAPTLSTYLYNPGLHYYPLQSDTCTICEGEWDTLAYYDAHPETPHLVLGKCGSGFNKNYSLTLSKSNSIQLLLDNDQSGRKQTASCIRSLISTVPEKSIFTLDWTLIEDAPKDIRDLLIEDRSTLPYRLVHAIVPYEAHTPHTKASLNGRPHKKTRDTDDPTNTSLSEVPLTAGYVTDATQFQVIESFDEYIHKIETFLYLTDEIKLAMQAVLGIASSSVIPGEPLWAFLIGPGSAGKTGFIESFGGNNQWFDNLSRLTFEALVSAWKDDTGLEASYIVNLFMKTLFVKDFTVTLLSAREVLQKLMGLLTDVFDGHVKIPYGNNLVKEFHNTYFNMVCGVTDIIHSFSSASIGERFIRIDWLGKEYDSREFARRALLNYGHSAEQKNLFTSYTLGYVKHLRTLEPTINIESEYVDPLIDISEFIAIVRTKVESDRFEGIRYRPRSELPSRLAKTFAKLFASVKLVTQSPSDAFKVIHKVALDTCHGFPLDILHFVTNNPNSTREQITHGIKIHSMRSYRVLDDLCTTGVLTKSRSKSGPHGGQPKLHYQINPKLTPILNGEQLPLRPRSLPKRRR